MGRGMAANLIKAGHAGDGLEPLRRNAVRTWWPAARSRPATPAEAAAGAELVMYCLSDDAAVEDLVWGAGDLLSAVQPGQIVVDMTTLHPSVSRKEAAAYAAKGARFLDAPVFGSKNEAANGGLWIVVGGDKALYEEVKPILEVLSETTHYMGENGQGTSMKLVGNLVVAAQIRGAGRGDGPGHQGGPGSRRRPRRAPRHRLQVADLRRRGQRVDQPRLRAPTSP